MIELRNESNLQFTDISSEQQRTYTFPDGELTHIQQPCWLAVSVSGGHRLLDSAGVCHYVPSGWIHLTWVVKDDAPHFVK